MSTGVVVVAGGAGTRLGAAVPKAFVALEGRSLLAHSVGAAAALPDVAELVVVVPAAYADTPVHRLLATTDVGARAVTVRAAQGTAATSDGPPIRVVAGGAERTDSVAAGVAALGSEIDVVLVHDAARALAPVDLFERVEDRVRSGFDAVVPAVPVTDTIKIVDDVGRVVETPDRATLRAVQTPQGFRRSALIQALARGEAATDEAVLVERGGGAVCVIDGDTLALKVTTELDLMVASYLLREGGGRSHASLPGLRGQVSETSP